MSLTGFTLIDALVERQKATNERLRELIERLRAAIKAKQEVEAQAAAAQSDASPANTPGGGDFGWLGNTLPPWAIQSMLQSNPMDNPQSPTPPPPDTTGGG